MPFGCLSLGCIITEMQGDSSPLCFIPMLFSKAVFHNTYRTCVQGVPGGMCQTSGECFIGQI